LAAAEAGKPDVIVLDLNAKLRYDALEVDRLEGVVRCSGREIALTPVELEILVALMLKNGCVASSEYLHERVWGGTRGASSSLLSAHVTNLRSKLAEGRNDDPIESVWGVGYRLRV
jgi:DNA-binding response OmpR family regulator